MTKQNKTCQHLSEFQQVTLKRVHALNRKHLCRTHIAPFIHMLLFSKYVLVNTKYQYKIDQQVEGCANCSLSIFYPNLYLVTFMLTCFTYQHIVHCNTWLFSVDFFAKKSVKLPKIIVKYAINSLVILPWQIKYAFRLQLFKSNNVRIF